MLFIDYYDPDAIINYDDGSKIYLSSYSGGASKEGTFGKLTLMMVDENGDTFLRNFKAEEDWRSLEVVNTN